jgi:hypothetical protein
LQISGPEAVRRPKEFGHIGQVLEVFKNQAAFAGNVIDDRIVVLEDIGVSVKSASPMSQPASKGVESVHTFPSSGSPVIDLISPEGKGVRDNASDETTGEDFGESSSHKLVGCLVIWQNVAVHGKKDY